jgi:hypothetical protein
MLVISVSSIINVPLPFQIKLLPNEGLCIEAHFLNEQKPHLFKFQNNFWFQQQKSSLTDKDKKRMQALSEIDFECAVTLLNININYLLRLYAGVDNLDVVLNVE